MERIVLASWSRGAGCKGVNIHAERVAERLGHGKRYELTVIVTVTMAVTENSAGQF